MTVSTGSRGPEAPEVGIEVGVDPTEMRPQVARALLRLLRAAAEQQPERSLWSPSMTVTAVDGEHDPGAYPESDFVHRRLQ